MIGSIFNRPINQIMKWIKLHLVCWPLNLIMKWNCDETSNSSIISQQGTSRWDTVSNIKIYVFVISAYAGVKIIMSLLMSVPCCHGLTEACYRWSAVRLVKWMHQVLSFLALFGYLFFWILCILYLLLRISDILFLLKENNYVGRGMHESPLDYIK